jgi:hypothetical protein
VAAASARISYTLSKSEDTSGNAFFSAPQDNLNIAGEKGAVGQRSTASPRDERDCGWTRGQGERLGGWPARALRGFQVGYVIAYATGVPFNVVAGSDLNNDANNNDRPSSVGRNSARQPATSSVDLRLSRAFALGRHHGIEAMLEAFNVFNHVNILAVNNPFGAGATPLPTFGQPTLAGDPRQIQLGVRWSF